MKKTNKIILASSIVAVLLLGIGYAAIQNITLNISGSAAADPSQSNFKVMFSGTPVVSDSTYVTTAITDDTNATINVEGLTKKGDVVTVTYTVQNASADLSTDLSVSTTNSNTEYFTLTSELAKTSLVAGEATTLTVTVELIKTPIVDSVSTTIGVQLTLMPVQPGEEGTSENLNDFSQTPDERNEYGFYFDKRYIGTVDGETVGIVFHEDTSGAMYFEGLEQIPAGSIKYDLFSIDLSVLDAGIATVSSDGRQITLPVDSPTGEVVFELVDYIPLPNGGMYGNANSTLDSAEWYNEMPEVPLPLDIYMYGDYYYIYIGDGWAVFLATEDGLISEIATATDFEFTDTYQTSYGPILDSINNKPVTNLLSTFEGCDYLVTSPKLPSGLLSMDCSFMGCDSLVTAPEIPESVTYMSHVFYGCKSLKKAPDIPNNVTSLDYTFADCTSLTSAPEIPSSVSSMGSTFSQCTALTQAPVIPSSVTYMENTFSNCTGLTGEITINANPTTYNSCFFKVDFTKQNLTLKGESTMLDELGATGNNYTNL
ncbi:MAG: leucine-rich repeat domain-containing protein [Clostridia bacterium]|nr:leucine-rich repeat domain-containing protein [Clostridia bacterium]